MEIIKINSKGPKVKQIQSLYNKIGYGVLEVDGIYGQKTKDKTIEFQKDNGLDADGIIGPLTYEKLSRFLEGYDTYYIKSGDTLFDLANKYYTTVNSILTANPNIDPKNLRVGQSIIIPYGIDVVFMDVDYTYEIMEQNIRGLKSRYPFIEVGIAGKSVLGKNIYYIKLGTGNNKVFYNATHHSLEWLNTPVLMKFIENFSNAYSENNFIRGYDIKNIWGKSSIYIIPMVNPDGVDLVLEGIKPSNPYYNDLIEQNDTGEPLSEVWNANIKGVDLNRNYPASWEMGKMQEITLGIYGPGPTRYGGEFPLSEPETQALYNFTRKHNFNLVLAYHSQGRTIYWQYLNLATEDDFKKAEIFSRASGYSVSDEPYLSSFAGYKDWFIKEFRKSGYTIETGMGNNPLPISQIPIIYENNEEILLLATII